MVFCEKVKQTKVMGTYTSYFLSDGDLFLTNTPKAGVITKKQDLSDISRSHGGEYEDGCPLGRCAV
jgi:hypothetical protein